jgi:hypothetical protein
MAAAVGRRFKIMDHTVIPSAETGRIGKKDLLVTYQDEAMRVRMVTIPYENVEGKSDDEQLRIIAAAIQKMEAERSKFVGKEITI